MSGGPTAIRCAGCGYEPPPDDPAPFRCPRAAAGDDVDHVMTRRLDASRVRFPEGEEANPYVRYRQLFHSWHLAHGRGMPDADYVGLVEELDKAVAEVDGHGFTVTPFGRAAGLSERLALAPGGVWVKDETGNVSGSHKARHLMGVMVFLRVVERLGLARGAPELAIASCGNAALAAAVVARAAGRDLRVFVPTWAEPAVVRRLEDLRALLTTCPRAEGSAGDPTYRRLLEAVEAGAIPFTCQGNLNGLAVEGGLTLGYEIVSDLAAAGEALDRVVVQVGGGALASALIQAFREAADLGVPVALPRVHAVQTEGGWPLKRAYDRLASRILDALASEGARPEAPGGPEERAALIARHAGEPVVREALAHARAHRSAYMWPWEEEPRSVASGILDDETYDWAAVVEGMLVSGGYPVVVGEETLERANALAVETTGVAVDHTGSAGLAGLLRLREEGAVGPRERLGVLFTGARR